MRNRFTPKQRRESKAIELKMVKLFEEAMRWKIRNNVNVKTPIMGELEGKNFKGYVFIVPR